jgi:hypothetical protein
LHDYKEDKVFTDFLEFEIKNNLFFNKISNVKYWHLIRFNIFREIQRNHFDIGEAHTNLENSSIINRVFLKFKQIRYFLFNNPLCFLSKRDILILNHQRRVRNNDYYSCLYTDILVDDNQFSSIMLEEPLLEKHFRPIKNKSILYTDYIDFIVAIKKRLFNMKISESDDNQIRVLADKINFRFNIKISYIFMRKIIYNNVISFKLRIKYYNKILSKIKPKVIIEVASYGMSRYVINYVAKEMGIPTIELQHGTMGKYHIAYNFKNKMKIPTFPDYIFTFGQLNTLG